MSKLAARGEVATAVFYIFSFLINVCVANNKTNEIQAAARKLRLFPHVIKQIPSQVIEVSYGKHKVKLGNTLKSDDIVNPPQISWPTKEDMLYTVAMIGPDAKNLEENCSYEHWLIGNIPGTDIEEGEVLSEYVGLLDTAYETDAAHRLIFWVYQQAYGERIPFDGARINKTDVGKSREVLNFARFVDYYGLQRPIAINFCEVFLNKKRQ